MARFSPALAMFTLLVVGACGGSSSQGGGGTGPDSSAGKGGVEASTGGTSTGGLGGSAGSVATGGGGAGGIDFDGAVLEGSLDVVTCTKNTSDSDCGTFPQCGCNLGEKCDVIDLTTGRTACVGDGSVQPNQGCGTFFGQCAAGSACVGGACKAFCATAADCPGANRECDQTQTVVGGLNVPVPGMFTCTAGCDPVNPGLICGAGLNCLFASTTSTDCFAAGSGVGPGTCTSTTGLACAPGTICIDTTQINGAFSCLESCRISANDCPANYSCKELNTKPTLGGVEYGACFAN